MGRLAFFAVVGIALFAGLAVGHESSDGEGFARLAFVRSEVKVAYNDVAWSPDDSEALVVGGIYQDSSEGSVIVSVKDGNATVLLNESGPPITDVEWHPGGGYALMLGSNSRGATVLYKYDGQALTNEWTGVIIGSDGNAIPNPFFVGRHIAFKPDGSYALLTGNGLIKFDGSEFRLLYTSSGGNFSNRIAFAPDGSYALIDFAHTFTEAESIAAQGTNKFTGDNFWGLLFKYHEEPFSLNYTGITYGRNDPERISGTVFTEVEGITFAPDGSFALVYGKDCKCIGGPERSLSESTIMKYIDATPPRATYIPALDKSEGRWSGAAFRPGRPNEIILSSIFVENLVWVRDLAAGTKQELIRGVVDLTEAQWSHDGRRVAYVGAGASMGIVTFLERPAVEVIEPRESATAVGIVNLTGTARVSLDGRPILAVEISVNNGTWRSASLFKGENGTVTWSYSWNSTEMSDGFANVTVKSFDGTYHSKPFRLTLLVNNDPFIPAPQLAISPPHSLDGKLDLSWTTGGKFTRWVIQRADDLDFTEGRLFYTAEFVSSTTIDVKSDGTFYFRMFAASPAGYNSNYSNVVTATVFHDLDNDGHGDREEIEAASDPRDPASTPEDRDGDGCANDVDDFPVNPLICRKEQLKPIIVSIAPADGETVTTRKPTILVRFNDQGVALSEVELQVDAFHVTSEAAINQSRALYTPSKDLAPGDHTVSIRLVNGFGTESTARSRFTVHASAAPSIGDGGSSPIPTPGALALLAIAPAALLMARRRSA